MITHRSLLVSGLLVSLVLALSASAQGPPDQNWSPIPTESSGLFGPNGVTPQFATVDDAGRLYAALIQSEGGFVGARLARWDGVGWTVFSGWVRTAFPRRFFAFCVSPSGDAIYVGGRLSEGSDQNGSVALSNVGRFDVAADTWDRAFVGPNDLVSACGVDASERFFASGSFTSADGTPLPNGLGRWDPASRTWSALGTPPGFPATLAVDPGGDVVIGTALAPIQIHRYEEATNQWSPLGNAFDPASALRHLATDGTNIYAAGLLTTANTTDYVLRWDGSDWDAYGASGMFGPLPLRSFALDGQGTVYAIPEAQPEEVYAREATASAMTAIGRNASDRFNYVVANPRRSADEAFIGGAFTSITQPGNNRITAYNHGRWDGTSWRALAAASPGAVYVVQAIEPRHPIRTRFLRAIVVGGDITSVDGLAVSKVALYDGVGWDPMGQGIADANGTVRAVASQPVERQFVRGEYLVYVGGQFSRVLNADGTPVSSSNVAVWNLATQEWGSLGRGVSLSGAPATGMVRAIAVAYRTDPIPNSPDYVYVGGTFDTATNADGSTVAVRNVARFNLSTQAWEPVAGGVDGPVHALELTNVFRREIETNTLDHGLAVGGTFPQALDAAGQPVPRTPNIVRLSSRDEWEPVGRGTNGTVRALLFRGDPECGREACSPFRAVFESESVLYVGGDFRSVTDGPGAPSPNALHPAGYLAKWRPADDRWDVFGHEPLANGVNGPVWTLRAQHVRSYPTTAGALAIVVGGDFTTAWSERTEIAANRLALLVDKRATYDFLPPESALAEWATETFQPYGGGLDDLVRDAAPASCTQSGRTSFTTATVYPGGAFEVAGLNPATLTPALALWQSRIERGGLTVVSASAGCNGRCRFSGQRTDECFARGLGRGGAPVLLATVGFGETEVVPPDSLGEVGAQFAVTVEDGAGTTYGLPDLTLGPLGSPSVVTLAGVPDPSAYAPNPDGADIGLAALSIPVEAGTSDAPLVQVVHAATDAPTVNVVLSDGTLLADSVGYGRFQSGVLLDPGTYTAEVRRHSDGSVLASLPFTVPADADAVVVALAGFLDPASNQNGPALTLLPVVVEEGAPISTDEGATPSVPDLLVAPNPVTGVAAVRFTTPGDEEVSVEVYDPLGRLVARLHEGPTPPGVHSARWDTRGLANGVYLVRLRSGSASTIRPVTVLR